ncbi:hypothetical protein E2C01_062103 [Portunus trituberculatus]|uniref:Uncharacterized protein n=1 Tax=Portunus trituberculatus TaxID=210409 RepID=A0A5B7HF77_PORTR|nr:hypothetical protein [Portunus trituberculatus]
MPPPPFVTCCLDVTIHCGIMVSRHAVLQYQPITSGGAAIILAWLVESQHSVLNASPLASTFNKRWFEKPLMITGLNLTM